MRKQHRHWRANASGVAASVMFKQRRHHGDALSRFIFFASLFTSFLARAACAKRSYGQTKFQKEFHIDPTLSSRKTTQENNSPTPQRNIEPHRENAPAKREKSAAPSA
jgi:hypothetical protein